MSVQPPLLPDVDLPVAALTRNGEPVRLRPLVPGEPRVDSASEYDDWGVLDIPFEESDHGRAMVEVGGDPAGWRAVGDMSWQVEIRGANLASRAVSIGLSLHVDARGRGIGTAAQSLLAGALHRAGVHRVEASTDIANIPEQRALARAGFVREGVARAAQVRADGRHDLVLFSCLPGEPTIPPR